LGSNAQQHIKSALHAIIFYVVLATMLALGRRSLQRVLSILARFRAQVLHICVNTCDQTEYTNFVVGSATY
jgi:hypothetical protein